MSIKSYEDLIVWQKAIRLCVQIYRLGKMLPEDERFGLRVQMQRAAVSIAANISEGHQRSGRRDFARFVGVSRGSLAELTTYLLLIREIGYVPPKEIRAAIALCDEVGRMLAALRRKLEAPAPKPAR